jgi:hypothetical protein
LEWGADTFDEVKRKMAALPPVPKVVRWSLQFTQNTNSRLFTHFYFQYSGTMSAADLATVAATWSTAFKNNILNLLSSSLTFTGSTATDLSSSTAPQVVRSETGAGSVATTANPSGTSMVVEQRIARRFKGGHARIYLPGTSNAQNLNAQQWSSTAITNMNTGFDNFVAAAVLAPPAAVGTLTQVTVSYFQGFTQTLSPGRRSRPINTLRATPLVEAITSHVTNGRVASQRRRNQQSL